jgi:methylmalonyl-CoA/ethylmalonyl-CoA epimerase
MKLRIDHIGIVVPNLEKALEIYRKLLDVSVIMEEAVGFRSAILKTEAGKIELMEPTDSESAVGKFLNKRGGGIHHVSIEVADVQVALDKATNLGLTLIDKRPRKGSEGKLIGFVHPKSLEGVLLEFCMPSPD